MVCSLFQPTNAVDCSTSIVCNVIYTCINGYIPSLILGCMRTKRRFMPGHYRSSARLGYMRHIWARSLRQSSDNALMRRACTQYHPHSPWRRAGQSTRRCMVVPPARSFLPLKEQVNTRRRRKLFLVRFLTATKSTDPRRSKTSYSLCSVTHAATYLLSARPLDFSVTHIT